MVNNRGPCYRFNKSNDRKHKRKKKQQHCNNNNNRNTKMRKTEQKRDLTYTLCWVGSGNMDSQHFMDSFLVRFFVALAGYLLQQGPQVLLDAIWFFLHVWGSGATHNKQNGCNIYFLLVGATSCPSLSNQSIMEQVDVYHIGRDKSPVVCDAIRLDANLRAWCPDCDDDGTPQHVVEHIYYFISIRIGSKVSFESGAKVHDGVYWFHCGM